MGFVKVLLQIGDFFLKAALHYVQTPEGKKEWSDIEEAYEGAVNTDDNPGVEYTVTAQGAAPNKRVVRN